jgi:uncharacterized protein (TIRG00374 family)
MKAAGIRALKHAFKAAVSGLFLYLVFRRMDFPLLAQILGQSDKPTLAAVFLANYLVTALLALRWKVIIGPFVRGIGFLETWRLTLVGLFFNVFLPTGAGGDIAKIYYLTRNQEEKLRLGISVLFDRFMGAVSVILMGGAGFLLYRNALPAQTGPMLAVLVALVGFAWLVIAWNGLTERFAALLPERAAKKTAAFFSFLRGYGQNPGIVVKSLGVSILCQTLSILIQYSVAGAFPGARDVSPLIFFIFIPLIWVSTLVPSLGGLGVREFSYSFFFAPFIGTQEAIALSLANLALITLQSALGGGVFLLSGGSRRKAPGGSGQGPS